MAAVWAGFKLLVLALAVGLALAGAVLGVMGLLALAVARAGGLEPAGALADLDAALIVGASHARTALAVLVGSAFGLACSRAASRRTR